MKNLVKYEDLKKNFVCYEATLTHVNVLKIIANEEIKDIRWDDEKHYIVEIYKIKGIDVTKEIKKLISQDIPHKMLYKGSFNSRKTIFHTFENALKHSFNLAKQNYKNREKLLFKHDLNQLLELI